MRDQADELIDSLAQPDIAVIRELRKLDDRGGRGARDWIIEILSPDTRARDQIRKRALYDCHGLQK